MRSLRREEDPNSPDAGWILRTFGLVMLVLVSVLLALGGLNATAAGGGLSGPIALLLAVCGLWIAMVLVRRRRER